jgi:hypothetical protein
MEELLADYSSREEFAGLLEAYDGLLKDKTKPPGQKQREKLLSEHALHSGGRTPAEMSIEDVRSVLMSFFHDKPEYLEVLVEEQDINELLAVAKEEGVDLAGQAQPRDDLGAGGGAAGAAAEMKAADPAEARKQAAAKQRVIEGDAAAAGTAVSALSLSSCLLRAFSYPREADRVEVLSQPCSETQPCSEPICLFACFVFCPATHTSADRLHTSAQISLQICACFAAPVMRMLYYRNTALGRHHGFFIVTSS